MISSCRRFRGKVNGLLSRFLRTTLKLIIRGVVSIEWTLHYIKIINTTLVWGISCRWVKFYRKRLTRWSFEIIWIVFRCTILIIKKNNIFFAICCYLIFRIRLRTSPGSNFNKKSIESFESLKPATGPHSKWNVSVSIQCYTVK